MPEQDDSEESAADSVPRAACKFLQAKTYEESLKKLSRRAPQVGIQIKADVDAFILAWRTSSPGGPLPERFKYKLLGTREGLYRVSQIYVSRGNFRMVLLFIHTGARGYLVDVFKKTRNANKNEVDTALDRAAKVWEEVARRERT
jgi:hypothetical protein